MEGSERDAVEQKEDPADKKRGVGVAERRRRFEESKSACARCGRVSRLFVRYGV